MRIMILAAVIAAGLIGQPASAMTPRQAACPVHLAPKTLGPVLVQQMSDYKEGQPDNPETTKALVAIVDACMKREKVAADQEDAYTKFVIARISRDELVRQFGTMGVPITVLDRVFGLGPGLANPTPDQITEDQFNTLMAELTRAGVKVDTLPKPALSMMGSYVAVTSEMYRDMALVR
jgi:hypothetical protein